MKSTRHYKRQIIWQSIKFCALIAIGIAFSACSKGGNSPTTPTLPNSFKITEVSNLTYSDLYGQYRIMCLYTNNTKDIGSVSGTIYYGDGQSESLPSLQIFANVTNKKLEVRPPSSFHRYPSAGTYTVQVDLTARFTNDSISDTKKVDFTITK